MLVTGPMRDVDSKLVTGPMRDVDSMLGACGLFGNINFSTYD